MKTVILLAAIIISNAVLVAAGLEYRDKQINILILWVFVAFLLDIGGGIFNWRKLK